jgi:hypothetical protein
MNLGSIAAVFGLHLPSRTNAVAQTQSSLAGTLASALAGTTGPAASTPGASPGDRIDTLIDQQVNAGTLTSDQGNAVRSFFANAAHHHHHHAGAAADPTAPSADPATASATAGTQLAAATGSQPADKLDALIGFLQNLRASFNTNATYGATAASANSSGLVVNANA